MATRRYLVQEDKWKQARPRRDLQPLVCTKGNVESPSQDRIVPFKCFVIRRHAWHYALGRQKMLFPIAGSLQGKQSLCSPDHGDWDCVWPSCRAQTGVRGRLFASPYNLPCAKASSTSQYVRGLETAGSHSAVLELATDR